MNQVITNKPHLGKVTFNVISDRIGGTRTTSKLYVYEENGLIFYRTPSTIMAEYTFLCPAREVIKFEATK